MADHPLPKGRLIVVGANHRSSSLMLRDRLFVEDRDVPAFLEKLRRAGVSRAVVLSTCDRVEVQAVEEEAVDAVGQVAAVLAETAGMEPGDLEGQVYVHRGESAVRHAFAVAASLDSQVIGEPQVMGQVKAGHRMAQEAGMCGGELESVFQAAYGAAKRVRTETAIGERPVSIAAAAVQLARDLHGDLDRCAGLMVGGGEMGELVAEQLSAAGLGQLTAIHAQETRARAMAQKLDCHWAALDTLASGLVKADIVIAALGARRHALSADMVRGALAKRRHKPIFLIDAAIPGDIEPAVNRLEEAFLYDLGDLEQVALAGRATREAEAQSAWRIVDEAVADYLRGQAERSGVPALARLRRHFEAARDKVMAEAGGDADKATRLLINRLLHDPSEVLREIGAASGGDGETAERMLGRLFRLDAGDFDKDDEEFP